MNGPPAPMVPDPESAFGPEVYGDSFADVYDDWYGDVSDASATASFVSTFGADLRVLELGVGTGRLAVAIADAGHSVTGIDVSAPMLERATRGAAALVRADMTHVPVAEGAVDVVLVATNTLFNLESDDAQRRCLAEARRVLPLGGRLVTETFVPAPPDPVSDRMVTTRSIAIDRVVLTATVRDHADRTITGQHVDITADGIRLRPWRVRYLEPDELDAMAADAGFRLGDRHGDWHRSPFTESSPNRVGVYVAI